MVTFGQFHFFVYPAADVVHHAAHVSPAGIGRDDDFTFHVFAVDGVRPHGRPDVGHIREGHFVAFRIVDHQITDTLHCAAVFFCRTDDEVERAPFLVHLRYDFSSMFTVTNSLNCGNEMPYRASISRFGSIFSSGRSICCSTFKSAIPSTLLTARFDLVADLIHFVQFVAEQFDAMPAVVPLSMASIRWLMGCPISMFAPDMTDNLRRTSSKTSVWLRSSNSMVLLFPIRSRREHARPVPPVPVLRATVLISGMESNSSSACRPILSDSSKEMPGRN